MIQSLECCPCCGSNQLVEENKALGIATSGSAFSEAYCDTVYLHEAHLCFVQDLVVRRASRRSGVCSAFGPKLMGMLATLTGVFHLSKREAKQLIQDLYGIDVSEGSVINIEERVENSLQMTVEKIHSQVMKNALPKHFDETTWRTSGQSEYVWIATTQIATCYHIATSRSRKTFEVFASFLNKKVPKVTDRYGVYRYFGKNHQYCLAHLIRDMHKYAKRLDPDGPLGKALENEIWKICKDQRCYREGQISKKMRDARLRRRKKRLEIQLVDGLANGNDELSGLCDRLLKELDKIWTFSQYTNVDPTNNLAERDLRKLVLWRKRSYGTRSERGKRFVERISSIAATARKAKRNVLAYVTESVQSFYLGKPSPIINHAHGF